MLVRLMMKRWPNTRKMCYNRIVTLYSHVSCFSSFLDNFLSLSLFSGYCLLSSYLSLPPSISLSLSLSLSLSTKLERDDTEIYRQREARAVRIAQEIEAKDKKRYGIDDTGTEEEQYEPSSACLVHSL